MPHILGPHGLCIFKSSCEAVAVPHELACSNPMVVCSQQAAKSTASDGCAQPSSSHVPVSKPQLLFARKRVHKATLARVLAVHALELRSCNG